MTVLICSYCANPEAYRFTFCPWCGCDSLDDIGELKEVSA